MSTQKLAVLLPRQMIMPEGVLSVRTPDGVWAVGDPAKLPAEMLETSIYCMAIVELSSDDRSQGYHSEDDEEEWWFIYDRHWAVAAAPSAAEAEKYLVPLKQRRTFPDKDLRSFELAHDPITERRRTDWWSVRGKLETEVNDVPNRESAA